ncbi:MAG: hypothetical protein WC944_11095 [Candidatus Cloacimonadaceae bacterium]|jgi:hypothetical protein|nr:hypothetical protein [Candidatus Cloacimonadota bacterium]
MKGKIVFSVILIATCMALFAKHSDDYLTDLYHLAIFYPQKQAFFSHFGQIANPVYGCKSAL